MFKGLLFPQREFTQPEPTRRRQVSFIGLSSQSPQGLAWVHSAPGLFSPPCSPESAPGGDHDLASPLWPCPRSSKWPPLACPQGTGGRAQGKAQRNCRGPWAVSTLLPSSHPDVVL